MRVVALSTCLLRSVYETRVRIICDDLGKNKYVVHNELGNFCDGAFTKCQKNGVSVSIFQGPNGDEFGFRFRFSAIHILN